MAIVEVLPQSCVRLAPHTVEPGYIGLAVEAALELISREGGMSVPHAVRAVAAEHDLDEQDIDETINTVLVELVEGGEQWEDWA